MTKSIHSVSFPNETNAYREARNQLLESEISLRREIESVARQRRELPLGGEVTQDYVFDDQDGKKVHLSELFEEGKGSLIIYSFMFGPNMPQPCSSCTSILDGLDGEAPHVRERVNLVVVAKSPIQRIVEFAKDRGWQNLKLLSSANNTYNTDYHAESEKGDQMPAVNVFVKREGRLYHSYNTELLYAPTESGQDGRHVDSIWPLWNLFDLTPEGRGDKWYPKLSYRAMSAS